MVPVQPWVTASVRTLRALWALQLLLCHQLTGLEVAHANQHVSHPSCLAHTPQVGRCVDAAAKTGAITLYRLAATHKPLSNKCSPQLQHCAALPHRKPVGAAAAVHNHQHVGVSHRSKVVQRVAVECGAPERSGSGGREAGRWHICTCSASAVCGDAVGWGGAWRHINAQPSATPALACLLKSRPVQRVPHRHAALPNLQCLHGRPAGGPKEPGQEAQGAPALHALKGRVFQLPASELVALLLQFLPVQDVAHCSSHRNKK